MLPRNVFEKCLNSLVDWEQGYTCGLPLHPGRLRARVLKQGSSGAAKAR